MVSMTAYSQNNFRGGRQKVISQKVAMPAKTKKRAKLGIHAPLPSTGIRQRQTDSSRLTFFDYDMDRITATTLASGQGCKKFGHFRRQLTRGAWSRSRGR